MALTLQAVVALDHSKFGSGLSSLTRLASNASGAMMMAFGGVTGEIFAMTKAFGAAGAAVGVMKQSITVGASFEQQMANVASVTGIVGDELDQVANAARDMAKETKFTATEAATALYSLGSAGISTADGLINTLKPSLLLAGATLSDTSLATETMTAALAAFSLPASEATNVANQLAGAIASSPANMERMSDAMKAAGPAAASLGISLEKAVAEVAMFNLVGLRGQMAGQAFRQVLTQLSKQAKDSSTEIGAALKGWDSSTEGITGAVRRLNSAGVTSKFVFTELGQRAGPALALLMKKGADAMDNLAARITASADVQKIYNIQMDTLIGKFSIFKSAIEEIWHVLFTKMSPALQQASDEMTKVADAVSKLIKAMLAGDWLTVAKMFSTLWDNIISGVKGVFESVREYAGKMADVFKNINWGDSFSTLTTSAVAAFTNIWTEAQSSISKISAFLKGQDWGAVWDNVKQGFVTAVNFWYSSLAEVWGRMEGILSGAIEKAKDFGATLFQNIGLPATFAQLLNALDSLKITFGHVVDGAKSLFRALSDVSWLGVQSSAIKMLDTVLSALIGTFNLVIKGINALISIIKTLKAGWDSLDSGSRIMIATFVGSFSVLTAIQAIDLAMTAMASKAIPLLIARFTALIALLKVYLTVTNLAVAGALAFGVGLGLLIRQIPGVASGLDSLVVKIGQFFHAVETEDQALKRSADAMKVKAEAYRAQLAVQNKATAATEASMRAADDHADALNAQEDAAAEARNALIAATQAVKEYTPAVKTNSAFLDAFTAKQAGAYKVTLDQVVAMRSFAPASAAMGMSLGSLGEKMTAMAPAAKTMQDAFNDLSNMNVAIKIDLPESMTSRRVEIWKEFFDALKDVTAHAVDIDIKLPPMLSHTVEIWSKFFEMLNATAAKAIKIEVDLPQMSNMLVKIWEKFFTLLNTTADKALSIDIQLPEMNTQIAESWKKFFSVFKGGDVTIPDIGAINDDISSIAGSLRTLASLKGVIWA